VDAPTRRVFSTSTPTTRNAKALTTILEQVTSKRRLAGAVSSTPCQPSETITYRQALRFDSTCFHYGSKMVVVGVSVCAAALIGCGVDCRRGAEVNEPSLVGSNVAFSVHCCSSPPSEADLISGVVDATVGEAVEYPAISGSGNGANGTSVIDADVDISAAAISIQYGSPFAASSGAFNGYVFEFTGGNVLIQSANLAPTTTAPEGSISVSHDESSVSVDVANLRGDGTTVIEIELGLAP
jgi:hypothetical protein